MLRRLTLACALTLAVTPGASADTIGHQNGQMPYGFPYSPSSSPFEAFQWTPLEFAAFAAYGGDFANVRKPVTPVHIFEEPYLPSGRPGPDDEQEPVELMNVAFFEDMPDAPRYLVLYDAPTDDQANEAAVPGTIPEPGTLALIGIGLLGVSRRLRRRYQTRG